MFGASGPLRRSKTQRLLLLSESRLLAPRQTRATGSGGLSVIKEVIADGEKALHPTDRFGDCAVRRSGLKLVL